MCTRISVFVPTTADIGALESWADACGIGLERVAGPGGHWRDTSILTTTSHCDCGTPVGSMSRVGPRHDPERAVSDLRKRGWSEAKIVRSLAQKRDASERRAARRAATAGAALTDWVTFLKGAPAHSHARSIGIFYREDGEWLSAKDLKDGRRETSALASLEPLLLARLEERVLHDFSTRSALGGTPGAVGRAP
jgi:hypothetical protein